MSVQKYRTIDLAVWLAITVGLEALIILAIGFNPNEAYVISVTIPVTLLVMMRWGGWSLIHAAGGGIALALLMGADWRTVLIYGLGNCLVAANLLWFHAVGKEKIRAGGMALAVYTATGWLLMCVGRGLVATLLVPDGSLLTHVLGFGRADSLTLLISLLALFIARRQNGVFEDQLQYLRRISKEEEERRANNQFSA